MSDTRSPEDEKKTETAETADSKAVVRVASADQSSYPLHPWTTSGRENPYLKKQRKS